MRSDAECCRFPQGLVADTAAGLDAQITIECLNSHSFVCRQHSPAFTWCVAAGLVSLAFLLAIGDLTADIIFDGLLNDTRAPFVARRIGKFAGCIHTHLNLNLLINVTQSFGPSRLHFERLGLIQHFVGEHLIHDLLAFLS